MKAATIFLGLCLLLPSIAGCRNGMRVAHGAVEAEGIGRNLKAMKRLANGGEFSAAEVARAD
jgi:hypothetical protein